MGHQMSINDYRLSHTAKGYGQHYEKTFSSKRTGFYYKTCEQPFLNKLFSEIAKNSNGPVLDFACGTGRITKILNNHFTDITAIDVSDEMLQSAKKSLPQIKFLHTDVSRENVLNRKFKLITAFRFILNAQPELRNQCLHWINKHLKDDGVLIINNHLRKNSLKGLLINFVKSFGLWKTRNILSDNDFKNIMLQNGFSCKKLFSFCLLPGGQNFPPVSPKLQFRLEKCLANFIELDHYAEQSIYICKKS